MHTECQIFIHLFLVCIIFALFLLWVMYKGRNSGKLWRLESGFWYCDIKLLTAGIAGCYNLSRDGLSHLLYF